MTFFIVLIAIALIIIWNALLNLKSSLNEQSKEIKNQNLVVLDELKRIQQSLLKARMEQTIPIEPEPKQAPKVEPEPIVQPEPEPEVEFIQPEVEVEEIIEIPEPEKPVVLLEESYIQETKTEERVYADRTASSMYAASEKKTPKEAKPSFMQRNPDLEKFIGENLINKIGIAILVLGIAYFVKYAISKEWINEVGRTAIGIACGGALIALAHRLRKSFTAFSSVLVGGGLATLYFTITLSFHEYHLFSQTVAFVLMVLITAFSVVLSLSYDRKELAILGLIGGFTSPFLLSTGEGNYQVLFTYITILNAGILALAYFKKWTVLNLLTYGFTILLFGAWLATKVVGQKDAPYIGALVFATIFYLLFFCMNVINNVKEKTNFLAQEMTVLISNTFLYYAAGMVVLNYVSDGYWNGLFTLSVALINFVFAFLLFKNKTIDKNLIYLLIGLVLTFVSLTGPIQLVGNHITLFWAAETVLLLWLGFKSGIDLLKKTSVLLSVMTFISLGMDWYNLYGSANNDIKMPILLNQAYLTGWVVLIAYGLYYRLARRKGDFVLFAEVTLKSFSFALGIAILTVLYLVNILELNQQMLQYVENKAFHQLVLGSYNLAFLIGLTVLAKVKSGRKDFQTFTLSLSILGLIGYLFHYSMEGIEVRENLLFDQSASMGQYLYHYLDLLLLVVLLFLNFTYLKAQSIFTGPIRALTYWVIGLSTVFVLSLELDHIVLLATFKDVEGSYGILEQNHKIGLPLLWGMISMIFMVIGMRKKLRDLRIISLSIFLLTLLKLFIYDIQGISEGGKIAAFIFLGVLLLVISFMYQKLKTIVLADDEQQKEEEK